MDDPLIIQALNQQRLQYELRGAEVARAMTRQYMEIENRLKGEMYDLAMYLEELRQSGAVITTARLMQMERYQELISQARAQQEWFATWATSYLSDSEKDLLTLGVNNAQKLIEVAGIEGGVSHLTFNRINTQAVEFAVGYAANGSPLYELLMASYPESVVQLTDHLVQGIALGHGPRATAKLMAEDMAGNLDRALTIARTEQLRALRTSNLEQMGQSDVVKGYIRRAQRSSNVCAGCLALDGVEYKLKGDVFASHPNCACFAQPVLKYGKTPEFETGPEWFDKQPPEVQKNILGAKRFELYQNGELDWSNVAVIKNDPVWGPTIKQGSGLGSSGATLGDLFPSDFTSPSLTPVDFHRELSEALWNVPDPKDYDARSYLGELLGTNEVREGTRVGGEWLLKGRSGSVGMPLARQYKDDVVTALANETGISYSKVNVIIRQWAQSSNDSQWDSLLIQSRVSELFNVPLSDWQKERMLAIFGSGPLPTATANGAITSSQIDSILRAMYDRTQKELREAGIKELVLFRGSVAEDPATIDFLRKAWKSGNTNLTVSSNALESWSSDFKVAQSFMFSGVPDTEGIVIGARIPIERIFGSARTGFGCLDEYEFVVLGGGEDIVGLVFL